MVTSTIDDEAVTVAPRSIRFAHVRALDGVRGLAVTLVVLYHFAPEFLPAGFLGVDVFFVLSGFLIASLALGEHRYTGRVAVGAFFARRARRLLPAAITTIVIATAIAVVLDPGSYRSSLRGQAVASLLYVNNWWAIAQNDTYQAVFGAESPLTHFWSLSIEEQFYLAFPFVMLVLVAIVRRRTDASCALARVLAVVAGVGAVASAAAMAIMYDPFVEPSRLYYGTGTRVQAVLLGVAGGCVMWVWRTRAPSGPSAVGSSPRSSRIWTLLGGAATIALVVASLRGGFMQSWLYRGGFFAMAIAALVLVTSVVSHRGAVARAFELRPFVTLGLFSYGIYLWHWPIEVFLDESRTGLDGLPLFALRVAVTAAATAVSYRLVERPFRSPRDGTESAVMVRALRAPRGALVAIGAMVVALLSVWLIAAPSTATYANSTDLAPTVESGPLRVLWAGDSVAWTMGGGALSFPQPSGYETVFDPASMQIWNIAAYPCPMVMATSRSFGAVRSTPAPCWDRATSWPERAAQFGADVVVWNGALFDLVDVRADDRWVEFGTEEWDALYLAALDDARVAATATGARFILVGQPDPEAYPDEKMNEAMLPENIGRWAHLRELEHRFAVDHPDDTRFIDLHALLCAQADCASTYVVGSRERIDGIHWSLEGARAIAPIITRAVFEAVDRPLPTH